MEVKIFNSFRGQDQVIAIWGDCPDYFVKWVAKNITAGKMDTERHKLDISSSNFRRFVDFIYSDINVFTIKIFFETAPEVILDDEAEKFFKSMRTDVGKMIKRKMRNLKIQICQDYDSTSAPVCKQSTFQGKVVYIKKASVDYGYGRMDRFSHHAEYFIYLSLRIFGIPLAHDTIDVDIRSNFLEKYNCQRVSQSKLDSFFAKNKGKKIFIPLAYMQSEDGWKWGFNITDKKKIIEQLKF